MRHKGSQPAMERKAQEHACGMRAVTIPVTIPALPPARTPATTTTHTHKHSRPPSTHTHTTTTTTLTPTRSGLLADATACAQRAAGNQPTTEHSRVLQVGVEGWDHAGRGRHRSTPACGAGAWLTAAWAHVGRPAAWSAAQGRQPLLHLVVHLLLLVLLVRPLARGTCAARGADRPAEGRQTRRLVGVAVACASTAQWQAAGTPRCAPGPWSSSPAAAARRRAAAASSSPSSSSPPLPPGCCRPCSSGSGCGSSSGSGSPWPHMARFCSAVSSASSSGVFHQIGPPKRPSPEAQQMQPVWTSGVMRCCAARCRIGTRQCEVVPKLWLPAGATQGGGGWR